MCGCGKGKMARPQGAVTTSNIQRQQTTQARVVSPVASPYSKQQMPAHLQATTRRTV